MLTKEQRATIMDACQSISRSADELKAGCSDGEEWDNPEVKAEYDAEMRLLGRLCAMLKAEPAEPLAWRVEWQRGEHTWVRTYTNERDAIDDGQAFDGTVTPLYADAQPRPAAQDGAQ